MSGRKKPRRNRGLQRADGLPVLRRRRGELQDSAGVAWRSLQRTDDGRRNIVQFLMKGGWSAGALLWLPDGDDEEFEIQSRIMYRPNPSQALLEVHFERNEQISRDDEVARGGIESIWAEFRIEMRDRLLVACRGGRRNPDPYIITENDLYGPLDEAEAQATRDELHQ